MEQKPTNIRTQFRNSKESHTAVRRDAEERKRDKTTRQIGVDHGAFYHDTDEFGGPCVEISLYKYVIRGLSASSQQSLCSKYTPDCIVEKSVLAKKGIMKQGV